MNSLTTVGGTVVVDDIDLGPLPPQSRGGSGGGKGSSSSRRAPRRLPPRSPTATSSSSKKPAFQRRDKADDGEDEFASPSQSDAPEPSSIRGGSPPSRSRRTVSWGGSSTKSTSIRTNLDDTMTIEVDVNDGKGNAYNEDDEFAPSIHRVGPVGGGVEQWRSTSLSPSSSSTTTTSIMGKKKWTPPRPRSVPRPSSLIDRRRSAPSTSTSSSSTMASRRVMDKNDDAIELGADRPIINKWRHYSDGYEFDQWQRRQPHPASYSSQISPPPPPPPHSPSVTAFHNALRSTSIIETLKSVANIEPYVSSPYFQRIFARGLSKLADGGGSSGEVVEDDVEDAIRKSFGLHDDMVRVIAAAAKGLMGMTTTGNDNATCGNSAMISPTNTATLATARQQDDNVDNHRVRLQRLLSMDLSGYSNKELHATSYDNGNGDCVDDNTNNNSTNKRHLRSVSMPPPSLQPQISSPSSSTTVPIQLTPSPSKAVVNKVQPKPPRSNGGLSSREQTWSSRPISLLLPQSSSVSNDPASRQSMIVVEGGGEHPYHMSSPPSANGGSFYFNAVSPPLPSRDTTIDSARRYLGHTTREEEVEDFLPSFLDGRRDDEMYDNESNSNNNNNNNADDDILTTNPAFRSPSSKTTTTISTVVGKRMTDAEEIIRLTEQSVGLLSLRDYKLELARIIAAGAEMENKFQSELDLAGREVQTKDEQIDQYRIIMEEAERAIASYEEAVHKLEEASNEKDALIEQLSERVSELELELERVLGEKTTTDAEHMTTIETLKANIVRMKSDAEVRDVDQSELHANITNLESKLDTVTKSYTASQAELTNAHGIIALRDERIRSSEQEVILMKEMLQGHIQLYQNEISLSLQNATLVMDSLTNQKDSIIATLNDKIVLLEQSLTELEEEKEVYAMTNEKSSKELNEKIHTLAIALTEKDRLIELLQQQQQQQHNKTRKEKAVSTPTSRPDPETSVIKLARHNRQAYATYSNNDRGGYGESKISSHYHSSPRQLIRQQGKTAKNERWHHQEAQRNQQRHHLTPEEYITTMESRDDDDYDRGRPLLPPRIITRERSHPKSSRRLVAPVLYYTTDDDSIFT